MLLVQFLSSFAATSKPPLHIIYLFIHSLNQTHGFGVASAMLCQLCCRKYETLVLLKANIKYHYILI